MPRASPYSVVLAAVSLAAAVSCAGPGGRTAKSPAETGPVDSGSADADGDGWTTDEDCDDHDPDIHPGAVESCNGIDDDCDGEVDESDAVEALPWWEDADGDGYGNPDVEVYACERPDGYSDATGDCDDTDTNVHRGATEICDGKDDDCDGKIDEDDRRWYTDADGDGWGDAPITEVTLCAEPSGGVLEDGDCDDTDPTIHPGATETWYDGVDTDCDGASDYDADRDGYDSVDYGGDDCDDTDANTSPWAIEMCDSSVDEDCDGLVDEVPCAISLADSMARLLGEAANDYAGDAVAGAGDVDGDGYADLLVGAWGAASHHGGSGVAYIVNGPVSGSMSLAIADARMDGLGYTGETVAAAGDVDGDGYADLLVGSPATSFYKWYDGAVSLVMGPVSGSLDLSYSWGATFVGDSFDAGLGSVADVGDVDGDGFDDILVGASGWPEGGENAGAAWLVTETVTGTRAIDEAASAAFIGEAADDYAGGHVSAAGDTNGDGYADFLVLAPWNDEAGDNAGAVHLVLGPATETISLSEADAKLTGEHDDAGEWLSIAGGGDLDGDGNGDLLIGSAKGTPEGIVRVFLGPVSGDKGLADADLSISGETTDDAFGIALASLGDVDGDGLPDVMVGGAPWEANTGHGCVYLPSPLGRSTSAAQSDLRFTPEAGVGVHPAYVGDVDGDGMPDFLAGAPAGDPDNNAGIAYIVSGAVLAGR